MLSNLVTVDINADQVFDAYVDVEETSRKARGGAVNLGKNDLWIAAVTKVTGATLLTCDKDFDHPAGGVSLFSYFLLDGPRCEKSQEAA